MKIFFIIILMISVTVNAQNKRSLTVEDLWAMRRIEKFSVSPDGKTIAFEVKSYSLEDNKENSDILLLDTASQVVRPFKNSSVNETEPRFHPDGKRISFIRDGQVWIANIDGSSEQQLTNIYTKASDHKWSPDGKRLLFVSMVYPECADDTCNKKKDDERANRKSTGQIFNELMYRHWDDWRGDKRSHLFLFDVETSALTDLTLNSSFDVPPIALGSDNDFSFSPVGNETAYTMNPDKFPAASTNNDIFICDITSLKKGKPAESEKISKSPGNDNQPVYSPDGKYIAFTSMKRAGYESDKQDIILYDRSSGDLKSLTDSVDLSASEIKWSPDSKSIYFTAANEIYNSIYKTDIAASQVTLLLKEHVNTSLRISADGKTIYFRQQRANQPYEIFAMNSDGSNVRQLTHINSELLSQLKMNPAETFWCEGAEGAMVQSILVKPPFFDKSKKYPVVFLIHGGPQGHWSDEFHYRWNLQMFAAQGYVVAAPNPRGSSGYGLKFQEEISGDWGGKAYTDLMNTFDHTLNSIEYTDPNNTFAAGASYGGYMINWLEGHTDRFNAVVSHDGVFNLESEFGTTEELWFPIWEMGGTPWEARETYEKWSPHRYIHNAKMPMLVIQGGMDFRVPEEQAFQLFTSLQKLGVPSRFLYFPDESHWVTKPQNSKMWWNTVFDWFNKYKKRS
jgi:dipeptidyl aminopeptidase/acylaminoacyl peptidase